MEGTGTMSEWEDPYIRELLADLKASIDAYRHLKKTSLPPDPDVCCVERNKGADRDVPLLARQAVVPEPGEKDKLSKQQTSVA